MRLINLSKEHPWNEYHGPRESIFHFECDGPNTIVHMEETHNYGPPGKLAKAAQDSHRIILVLVEKLIMKYGGLLIRVLRSVLSEHT